MPRTRLPNSKSAPQSFGMPSLADSALGGRVGVVDVCIGFVGSGRLIKILVRLLHLADDGLDADHIDVLRQIREIRLRVTKGQCGAHALERLAHRFLHVDQLYARSAAADFTQECGAARGPTDIFKQASTGQLPRDDGSLFAIAEAERAQLVARVRAVELRKIGRASCT